MASNKKLDIKIFGSHCRRCQMLKELISKAVMDLNLEAEIECLTEPEDFLQYKVLYLPAFAINGKLILQGGVPSPHKFKELIEKEIS